MKRRMIALVLTTALMGSMVSGCGAADTAQEKTVDEETETGQTNGVFTGELEKNVTIQVLENDTAISKGYFMSAQPSAEQLCPLFLLPSLPFPPLFRNELMLKRHFATLSE